VKRFNFFKSGTHTSAGGTTLEFSEEHLKASAEAYDPSVHEAPLVIGHPQSNNPAFGWVKSVGFTEHNLFAEPQQVNADFEEMVQEGAFKKVSASWYTPDSPNNPVPGVYYLRHIGFLGAQPPAIKGLQAIEFSEEDEFVEFEEDWGDVYQAKNIAGFMRRFREFVIEKFGKDDADHLVPDYIVEDTADHGRAVEQRILDKSTNESHIGSTNYEDHAMDIEEMKVALEALEEENGKLKARVASFHEATRQAKKDQIISKIDGLIGEGKMLESKRDQAIEFSEQIIDLDESEDFSESSEKTDALLGLLVSAPSADFSEQSGEDEEGDEDESVATSQEVAAKAVQYQEEQAALGNQIDIAAAVRFIKSN